MIRFVICLIYVIPVLVPMYTCSLFVFCVSITFISTNKMCVHSNSGIMSGKRLTSSQIAQIINGLESEDEFDFSTDSESDYCPEPAECSSSDDEDSDDRGERPMDLIGKEPTNKIVETPDVDMVCGKAVPSIKELSKRLIWKQKNLILNDNQMQFRANTALPSEIMELELPIEFFSIYFLNHYLRKSETKLISTCIRRTQAPILSSRLWKSVNLLV